MRVAALLMLAAASLPACAAETFPRYEPPAIVTAIVELEPEGIPPVICCGETVCQLGEEPSLVDLLEPEGEFRCYIFSDGFWHGNADRWEVEPGT